METVPSEKLAVISGAQRTLRDRAIVAFPYLLTFLFLCLTLWGILHHEMWRDELQAWLVARDSSSLLDVVHNVRFERSPALWQISLRLLTYFTSNPIAMQFFHLAVATTSIFLFAKYSPFTKLQQVMFTFGYFPFYEYAVISRSYALGVLLVIVVCVLLTRPSRNYLAIALTLGLMANTSVYGLMLAPAFALYVVCELVFEYIRTRLISSKKVLAAASLVFVASLAVSFFQLLPPDDYTVHKGPPEVVTEGKDSLAGSFQPIFFSYVAIPNVFAPNHWGTNILETTSVLVARRVSVLMALLLFLSVVVLLLRKPTVLLTFVSGTGVFLWFSANIFLGVIRHKGHLFILLVACFWLVAATREPREVESRLPSLLRLPERYQVVFLSAILFLQLVGGVFAMAADLRNPFSETRKTAEFVRDRLTPTTVFSGWGYMASPMTAYLEVECYMLDRQVFGTFMIWDDKIVPFANDEEKLQNLAKLLDGKTREVLYVSEVRLKANVAGLEVTELAEFSRSFNSDKFYVYQVRREGDQLSQNNLPNRIPPDSPPKP